MAKYFYRLGSWAVEHRKKVLLGSLGILLAMVIIALSMGPKFNEEMTIPGTESEKAGKVLSKAFPTPSDKGGQVHLVMKAPKNRTLESDSVISIITETLNEIKEEDSSVESVLTPVELGNLSEDKTIGYAVVSYNVKAKEVKEYSKELIKEKIEQTRAAGIQTELAGDVAFSELEIGGVSEVIGVIIAFLVLAITFTSFLAAGMPILTAAIGLGIGIMMILMGTHFLDIPAFSLSLAAMLGLAVGIDYALFIVSRFRQQLAKGYSVKESVSIANGTAGSAVVFAGVTVIIALLGLSVAKIPFLSMMGVAAAVCVFVAILIAVILVPAILGILGHKISATNQNSFLKKITRSEKAGSNKWGKFITKRPLLVAITGVSLLLVTSIPFLHMELGLPDNGTKSTETTERRAYDLLSEAYGPGYHSSLVILAETTENTKDVEQSLNHTIEEISDLSNVKAVTPAIPSPTGDVFMISVTPTTGPNDIKTKELVNQAREKFIVLEKENDINIMMTGATAVNIDISQKLNDALPTFSLLIVGFAFFLLVIVFRSILIPIKAVLGFLLSLGATLGFTVFVLQDGHFISLFGFPAAAPVLSFLPVIVIGILFGLAMDYEMFLVSRMREKYTHSGDARKAILTGLKESGGVVTSAGLIMIAVFAGFMLAPDPIIKSMGFALTFGVLFDALIVRMTIVPAVMTLMGKSAWYLPAWLDRVLPNLDIEGESFMRELEDKHKVNVNNKVKVVG
jgi:membrane protein YdfJ